MKDLLESASARAIRYLEDLDARAVAPDPGALDAIPRLDEPLPEDTTDPEATIQLLDEIGSPASMAMAGPRFYGFVTDGSLPVTLAANWLAGAWDQNCVFHRVTPATATLETVALKWLLDILHLPAGSGGAPPKSRECPRFAISLSSVHVVGWSVPSVCAFLHLSSSLHRSVQPPASREAKDLTN